MANKKQTQYYIITDENNRPMAWAGDQLCYCNDETWEDEPHTLKMYTEKWANKYIRESREYKEKNNLTETQYRRMPIDLPLKFQPYNKVK